MQLNFQDQMLKAYIDKIFDKYDTDKSGTLDQNQLTFFFNDLFKQLGINTTVTQQQSMEAIKSIDQNSDGGVDKKQLFDAFRLMINRPQPVQTPPPMTNSYPPPNYPQYVQTQNPYNSVQHNPYGIQNPYQQPPPQQYYPYQPYQQPPNQYQPYQPPYNQYGQYNPYMNQGGMGGSTGGNRWGRMQ